MLKKKIVVILVMLIVLLTYTENVAYAAISGATARGKALIGFAEYNDFSENEYGNLLAGASDPTAIRLMGIFVSNWFEPGMALPIRDLSQLTTTIKDIIVNNMKFPEEIAALYAGQIAYNMVHVSVNLDIVQAERDPLFYISNSDATQSYLERLGGSQWLRDEHGVYGYVKGGEKKVFQRGDNYLKAFSYYNAVKTPGAITRKYTITKGQSLANDGVVSLNDILFGSDYGHSGDVMNFWGSPNSGIYRNSVTEMGISSLRNYDKDGAIVDKVAWIQLEVAQGSKKGKVVWSNNKVGCRLSAMIARNIIATSESNRTPVFGSDKDGATGNTNIYVSASSPLASEKTVLLVDPFGNILAGKENTGNVVIPACMNPYTFDSKGNKVVLSNNFAMGYLYPTDTGSTYERNAFQGHLNFSFASIKRMKENGVYRASFVTAIKQLNDNTNKVFKSITTGFEVEGYDNGGAYKDWEGLGVVAIWERLLHFKEFVGVYSFTMPVGMVEWAKTGKPTGNSRYSAIVNASNKIWEDSTVTIDLVRYGGTWEFDGTWGSLIQTDAGVTDENGQLKVSSTLCNEIVKSTNKYGKSQFKTAGSSYVYGLYVLYAHILTEETIQYEVLSEDGTTQSTIGIVTEGWNACANFPDVDTNNNFPEELEKVVYGTVSEKQIEQTKLNILQRVDALTNPEQAYHFVPSLIGQRMTEAVLGWHYDIVGLNKNTDNSALMGDIGYSSSSGYVTVPEMRDIPWLSAISDKYDSIVAIAMIIMTAVLVLYTLIGIKSIQNSIASLFLFGFCLFCVPVITGYSINITNTVSNSLIKNKFQYWVVTQQQAFISKLSEAYEKGDVRAYLQQSNAELIAFANGSSATTTLTWMTPKKDDYIGQLNGSLSNLDKNSTSNLIDNKAIMSTIKYLGNTTLSGQRYVDENVGYLYRSYTDISMYAKIINERLKSTISSINNGQETVYEYFDRRLTRGTKNYNLLGQASEQLDNRANLGSGYFIEDSIGDGSDLQTRYRLLTSSQDVNRAILEDIESNKINKSNYSLLNYGLELEFDGSKFQLSGVNDLSTNDLATYQFLLYTESPFYYLFNSLSDKGTMSEGTSVGFRTTVLKDNYILSDSITDRDGNYATKDFVDFEGFFKYVLPYLRQANDVVLKFDDCYGLVVYDTIIDADKDLENFVNSKYYSKDIDKAWHNKIVKNMWNLYSPWVDIMSECNYAQPEVIETMVGGKLVKATVKDPLNPASYKELKLIDGMWYGRDMIFGEEDMLEHGLTYSQLSSVEKKIYDVLEESKEDIYMLLNYHDYDNQVLTTAAAMSILFNFNKTFSESKILRDDLILYPQGYELKNFGYDAYLRTALINATGMPIQGNGNMGIYATIVNNTNVIVGILMCADDIVAMYGLAYLKVIFVSLLVLLGMLSVLYCITSDEMKLLKIFKDNVIIPNIKFLVVSVLHALVAGIIMGSPKLNVITKRNSLLNITDPVTVLVALLVVQLVVLYLYAKICVQMITSVITLGQSVINSVGGVFETLGASVISKVHLDGVIGSGIASGVGTLARGISSPMLRSGMNGVYNRRVVNAIKKSSKGTDELNERFSRLQESIEAGKAKLSDKTESHGFNKVNAIKEGIASKANILSRRIRKAGLDVGSYTRSASFVLGRKISPEQRYQRLKQDIQNGVYSSTDAKIREKLNKLEGSKLRGMENSARRRINDVKILSKRKREEIENYVSPILGRVSEGGKYAKMGLARSKSYLAESRRKVNNFVRRPVDIVRSFNKEVFAETQKRMKDKAAKRVKSPFIRR